MCDSVTWKVCDSVTWIVCDSVTWIVCDSLTWILCDSVTWIIICAPILRTDHVRLRCQKDQRASPWFHLMYKAEMQSVCCQRQLHVGTPLRLVRFRAGLPPAKQCVTRRQFIPTNCPLSYDERSVATQNPRFATCCSCSLPSAIRLLSYRHTSSSNIKTCPVSSTHSPTTHSPSLYLNFRPLYLYLRTTFTRRTSGEQKENLQISKFSLSLLFVTQLYILTLLQLSKVRVESSGSLCVKFGHVNF